VTFESFQQLPIQCPQVNGIVTTSRSYHFTVSAKSNSPYCSTVSYKSSEQSAPSEFTSRLLRETLPQRWLTIKRPQLNGTVGTG
jgi:hypothetical protein